MTQSQVPQGAYGRGLLAPAGAGGGRGVEVLRRVLLLGGVLAAAWMVFHPAAALVRVGAVDFAEVQKRRARVFGRTWNEPVR